MRKEHHSELIVEMTPFVEEICGKDVSVSVLDTAQKYYRELVAENAAEHKAMYPHTRNRIYPGIAVFRALTDIGIARSRAAEMFRHSAKPMTLLMAICTRALYGAEPKHWARAAIAAISS